MKETHPRTYRLFTHGMKRFQILYDFGCHYERILKFLISGGTAAGIDLMFLFFFVHYLHMWYLYAVILANLLAIGISFIMQKFWTFKNQSLTKVHTQFIMYMIVQIVNFFLNIFLVYMLVRGLNFWYLLAQCIASILLAILSFNMYRYIFKQQP